MAKGLGPYRSKDRKMRYEVADLILGNLQEALYERDAAAPDWWGQVDPGQGRRALRREGCVKSAAKAGAATLIVAAGFASPLLSRGQSAPNAESSEPTPIYHLLPEDDDWSFLADPAKRQVFWDPIKYIRLRPDQNDWFLSIGGEARYVWEQIGNDDWGQQPFMDAYFNERYLLYFDVHYGKHVRSFVELKSGVNSYRIGGPRPIDEKKLDFQAAFLEVGIGSERNWIKFRAGRHEMGYGSGRLIDMREGPNVRLSFDGFKVRTGIGRWQIDGFAVRPDWTSPDFLTTPPTMQSDFGVRMESAR